MYKNITIATLVSVCLGLVGYMFVSDMTVKNGNALPLQTGTSNNEGELVVEDQRVPVQGVPAYQANEASISGVVETIQVSGLYSFRPASASAVRVASFQVQKIDNTRTDVLSLKFNDEPTTPDQSLGASFKSIVGTLQQKTCTDRDVTDIEVTVEVKNPVYKKVFSEGVGDFRVMTGDFVRVISRGEIHDECTADNGHGGTSTNRVLRTN